MDGRETLSYAVQRYDLACDGRTLEVGIGRYLIEKCTVERGALLGHRG